MLSISYHSKYINRKMVLDTHEYVFIMASNQGKGNVLNMDDWFLKSHPTVVNSVMALIADYGYQSFEEIPSADKCLLASALLEDDKAFCAEHEFITASPNFDHMI